MRRNIAQEDVCQEKWPGGITPSGHSRKHDLSGQPQSVEYLNSGIAFN